MKKPLLMKMATSATGFFIGDVLAQTCIQKNPELDYFRLFRLASFGFLVHGSTSHWFYGMLDGKIPGTSAGVVASKVFIDQVLWNPIFGIMFFSYVALWRLDHCMVLCTLEGWSASGLRVAFFARCWGH